MKSILDSRLWIRLDLEPAVQANTEFLNAKDNLAHFGAQLLLYDKILIPTKDFGIIPVLANWCGIDGLRRLLKANALGFTWQELHEAYGGGGSGLIRCAVDKPESGWENWQQVARWGKLEESAEAQVENSFPELKKKERSELLQSVLANSTAADVAVVKQETYSDISANDKLMGFVFSHEKDLNGGVYLNRLSGMDSNQIRILNRRSINNGIDLVLRVAEINTEISIAASFADCDLSTSSGADVLMANKLQRAGATPTQIEKFVSILNLERIPDVRPAIEKGELPLPKLIDIRQRSDARKFRRCVANFRKRFTKWPFWKKTLEIPDPCCSGWTDAFICVFQRPAPWPFRCKRLRLRD